ncbi:MAG: ParB/RepB/Spo0J family partition protein [Pseudomonadota bacterium]
MSKKRRVFDIDLPADDVPAGTSLDTKSISPRRGPMASAIGETADSLRDRRLVEAQIREENDALAREFVRLKGQGLILDRVPLDQIRTTKLIRDRRVGGDLGLDDLKESLCAIGLSNPIQVEQVADGYELIQGFRRLSAYQSLLDETGDVERWGAIPATLVISGEALEALYRRMVDENLVRKDISFAEMASLAIAYAADPQTEASDPDAAIGVLYGSAGRQKRNYIGHFVRLLERLEDVLEHPEAIPRALGLELAKRLEAEPALAGEITTALGSAGRSAEVELSVLRRCLEGQGAPARPVEVPTRAPKSTFRLRRSAGEARCIASDGRLELRFDKDFSALDRKRLERAVAAFFDALEAD